MFGKNYDNLGTKWKAMLQNIGEIKRLMWSLQNSDCVTFHIYLDDLIKLESLEARSFSIFKYCDDDTNLLIRRLQSLAKKRVFEVVDRKPIDPYECPGDSEDNLNGESGKASESDSGAKGKKSKRKQRKGTLEKDYGHLYQGLNLNRWLTFADQACTKQPLLKSIEDKKDLKVIFEQNPKFVALTNFLESSSPTFTASNGKRSKPDKADYSFQMPDDKPLNVLIAAKTPRMAQDIQRFLHARYLRGKNGERTFYEDKLRYHLNSYREYCHRE